MKFKWAVYSSLGGLITRTLTRKKALQIKALRPGSQEKYEPYDSDAIAKPKDYYNL